GRRGRREGVPTVRTRPRGRVYGDRVGRASCGLYQGGGSQRNKPDIETDQFGRQPQKTLVLATGKPPLKKKSLANGVTKLMETLLVRRDKWLHRLPRTKPEHPNARNLRLRLSG